jgi:2-succinyl-6-hydroxy-2,4-cyclohexadiene-1-carboxylate synthase
MHERRVKAGQIELQVREYEHDGEAIIFLHFSGANLWMWQRAIPIFQDRYRLILVDLRGHGKSDKPERGYHMDQMAHDVIAMMPQLELERAHIVGSSLGAEVGLSMAANDPEKVLSLVCEGAVCSEYGPYSAWEGSEAEFEAYVAGQLERIRESAEKIYPSVDALVENSREVFEKQGWWNPDVEAMVRYGAFKLGEECYTKGFRKQALEDYMGHYFRVRFEEYYRKVKCPMLMLVEAEGPENEREMAVIEKLQALARRGQIVAIAGWVHPYGWLLNPEAACAAITTFLQQGNRPQP